MSEEEREPLTAEDTMESAIWKLCEGNAGAIRVIMELTKREDGTICLYGLDDMNIRGTQVWIGFKDHCGEDIDKFARCILHNDQAMVDTINKHAAMGNHKHLAVRSGASKLLR